MLGLIHYALGLVTLLQFGCIPIADEIQHISGAFVVYILAGTWGRSLNRESGFSISRCSVLQRFT